MSVKELMVKGCKLASEIDEHPSPENASKILAFANTITAMKQAEKIDARDENVLQTLCSVLWRLYWEDGGTDV